MNDRGETNETIIKKTGSLNFFWKKIQALNEQRNIPIKLIVGKTKESVTIFHMSNPNESKSWPIDGIK